MVKLITDVDLDGLGCGVLAKFAFGEKVDVCYCSYRNLNQRVEAFLEKEEGSEEELYITDLSVNEAVEHKLAKRFDEGKHVKVLDHHVTALHFNQYEWGSIKTEYENGKKTCATSLFYDYLLEKQLLEPIPSLEQFVDLVRQYDTWEWDENNNITAKRLNDLFYILDRELYEEEIMKRISENHETFSLTDTETMILNIEENKIERYIHSKNKQIVQTYVDEYCCGIVHAEQYLSELGNALNKLNPHLDFIALMNVGSKKIGFRTIHDEVNVAEFAKRFGGGGHPKASGCELSAQAFEKFVVNVFDIPPMRQDPEKNMLNLKNGKSGTIYHNRKREVSLFIFQPDGSCMVIHNGKKIDPIFADFETAEKYVKRNFQSWLCYDDECIKLLEGIVKVSPQQIRENYQEILSQYFQKISLAACTKNEGQIL